jgi:uncharacterized protein YbaR (Trm112 family)
MDQIKIFTCGLCKGTFKSLATEEEAEAEYTEIFGKHMGEAREILCDDCDRAFKKWYANLSKEALQ